MALAVQQSGRAQPRTNTFLSATALVGEAKWTIRLRNISVAGAMVESDFKPVIGSSLTICRGNLRAEGVVVWCQHETFGVRFLRPLRIQEWVSVPARLAISSAAPSPTRGDAASDELTNGVILQRLMDELSFISRSIEAVGDLLTNDPILRVRHASSIQQLCISSQMLNEVTLVLKSDDKCLAVEQNVTGPMRNRLLRR